MSSAAMVTLLGHGIYVTASVLGACTYVGLDGVGVARFTATIAGFLVTFTVRSLAIKFGWSLPVFREASAGRGIAEAPREISDDESRVSRPSRCCARPS